MRTCPWIVGLCLLMSPAVSRAAVHWDVRESGPDRLLLEIRVEGASLEEVAPEDGPSYQRIRLPGAIDGGEAGYPMLPHALRWAVLPPDGTAELRVLSSSFQELGRGRLLPRPVPGELIEGSRPGVYFTSERLAEADNYGSFRSGREKVLELGDPIWMARQRMVPLRLRPVAYDAGSGRIEILESARIEIRFSGGDALPDLSGAGANSEISQQALNPEMAQRWRSLPPRARTLRERWSGSQLRTSEQLGKRVSGILPFDAATLESDEIRLRIPTSQLWQLPVGALLEYHGLSLDFPRSHLRLYERRMSDPDDPLYPAVLTVDVPFHLYGDPDPNQNITRTDALVFFGESAAEARNPRDVGGTEFPAAMEERPENYNNDNCYFLAIADPGAESWARMDRAPLAASGGSPQASFAVLDHFEVDQAYQDNPASTDEPRYHWNAPNALVVEAALNIRTPAAGTTFDITATVTRTPVFGNADRFVEFTLVDDAHEELLQTLNVKSPAYGRLTPVSWSRPGDDWQGGRLRLRMNRDNYDPDTGGGSFLSTYLGSVEIAYDALYQANRNILRFDTGQVGGTVDVEVGGFTTSNLMLVETTDPNAPRWIDLAAENLVDVGGGATRLSLRIPQQAGEKRRFAVLPHLEAPEVTSNDTELDPVAEVLEATGPAQVLAIGPAEFAAATEDWLQWRRDQDRNGWAFRYVDIQQIYDDFSGGLKDPGAIKEFLQYYYVMHAARAVLLVGDGNENARELGSDPVRDFIPTRLHVQVVSNYDELLASDKWFVTYNLLDPSDPDYIDHLGNYPKQLQKGPDMLIGRLPVNSVNGLQSLTAKIKRYEQPTADQTWRGKTLWIADDSYSTSVLGNSQGCYEYWDIEDEFLASQEVSAQSVRNFGDGSLSAEVWHIEDVTKDLRVQITDPASPCYLEYSLGQTRGNANAVFPSLTNAKLSEGWLWVSYQGHANFDVLAHENMLLLQWLNSIGNLGTPFLFFGMGCHVTDFIRVKESEDIDIGRSIGEALVNRPSGGAIATYGSSGFEYLSPNSAYMKLISRNFFELPRGASSVLDPSEFDSPWILAEAMAQSELDIVTLFGAITSYREMMAQYNLLGDPLLRVDALPARVSAEADGAAIGDGETLVTTGDQRSVQLALNITDETGLGRAELLDITPDANLSDGIQAAEILRTHSAQLTVDPVATDLRLRTAQLALPIVAQDYKVLLEVYDGSYPDRRPTRLLFDVPMPLTLFADGEEVPDLSGLKAGGSVDVRVEFAPPIALLENEIQLRVTGGTATGMNLVDLGGDGRNWELSFALNASADEQVVELDLAGTVTELGRRSGGQGPGTLSFRAHYPFPNPTAGSVRFVGDITQDLSGLAVDVGLEVFDLSGRPVYRFRGPADHVETSRFVLEWDGRDKMGDELANGVYLYRLDARAGGASVRSEMGRLVFMR